MAVADLRVIGRATQGVRLIKIDEGDAIAAVAKVDVEVGTENGEGEDQNEDLNAEPLEN
jgi:DNA gyrase subunit A